MAFKETVRSMRTYLLLVGVLSGISDLKTLGESDGDTLVIAYGALGLAIALAFVYCGARLRPLLANSPGTIQKTLYATIAVAAVSGAILGAAGVVEPMMWAGVGINIAIALYLLANVKRLAADVQGKSVAEIFD